jgi:predicted DNA-binding protein with PD1-like motif
VDSPRSDEQPDTTSNQGSLMQAHELTTGRTFGVTFDHGEDFFETLAKFCREHEIRQGYIPMFLAGFAEAEIVGTCEKLENPDAPVWSKVHLENVEAFGCGTIAQDGDGGILPHVHASLGLKARSATGHTSHLLSARIQFLVEMLVVEVVAPPITRPRNPDLYDVPLLRFGND